MTGQLGSPQIWGREHQGGLCLWFELLGSGALAGGKLPSGLARLETLGDKHAESDLNMKIVHGCAGCPRRQACPGRPRISVSQVCPLLPISLG